MLRGLAADAPVVVAIDDEQWLDRASARVLAFALRRIRAERICLLLSRRVDSHGALWAEVQRTFTPGIEVVEIPGLDMTGTHQLLAGELTGKIQRRLVERVHWVSGGNPLYVLALGGELKRRHAGDWVERELPIPRTLADAIGQQLEHVRVGVEAALFAIAALANPTLALLSAAIGEFRPGDLDDAAGAGVLEIVGEAVRFTHPVLASVHYASVRPQDRRELHLRLAAVVPDQEERALHLALGTDTPDSGVAGEIDGAAELAARRGAPEAAAELLEHAIRLTPVDQDQARWARMITAADRHRIAGDFAATRRLLEQVLLERPNGGTSARARLLLALVRTDDFAFAVWMLEQALADAGEDDRLITQIEMVHQEWCINLGDYAGTVSHAQAALASAERLGDPGPVAAALAALGGARFVSGQPLPHDLFERAIELEHEVGEALATLSLPSLVYGGYLRHDNDFDAARPLLEAAVARARRRGEDGWLPALLVRLAMVEWAAGNWNDADRHLAEAAEGARQQLDDEIDSWIAHLEGALAAARGELEGARVGADEALALATRNQDKQLQREAEILIAEIDLWTGQPDAAHGRLQPWRERTILNGPWFVAWWLLPLWSSDIEALIALGRLDQAQLVVDDLLQRAGASQSPHAVAIAKRCDGLLLAARGQLANAIDALDLALAEHARQRLPLELGRTLLDKGSLERRAKRKTAAKHTLVHALAVLEPLGAARWAERVQ